MGNCLSQKVNTCKLSTNGQQEREHKAHPSEAIESAWLCSVRVRDWSDRGRVHVGDTKNWNKTCESENMCPSNKWDQSDEASVSVIVLMGGA